jgi:hypothetical protein
MTASQRLFDFCGKEKENEKDNVKNRFDDWFGNTIDNLDPNASRRKFFAKNFTG